MASYLGSKILLGVSQIRPIIISTSTSFKEATEVMDRVGLQIVLVADQSNKLIGLITDGDLRRAVLGKTKLSDNVSAVVKKGCYAVKTNALNNKEFNNKLERYTHIAVVSENHRITGLLIEKHLHSSQIGITERNDTPVVIMAGGKGSRLAPFTKILPKPLLPVGDKTIIERIIDAYRNQGFWNFVVVVNYKKELIKAYFAELEKPYEITFIDETKFLGTVGGVSLIKNLFDGNFLLSNADILLDIDYLDALQSHVKSGATASVIPVNSTTSVPYGVVKSNDEGAVIELVETPSITHRIVSGVYIFSQDVFEYLPNDTQLNMDELLNQIIRSDGVVNAFMSDGVLHDMGDFEAYRKFLDHFGSK